MSTASTASLSGQDTLVASWRALASLSPEARVVRTQRTVAAVFPAWTPLNNAILMGEPSSETASMAAAELKHMYDSAGVDSWALWLPAPDANPDTCGQVGVVGGMRRDTTTLVMELMLSKTAADLDGVGRTTVAAADQVGAEPVPERDLPPPDEDTSMNAWVMIQDGLAVAGAWSLIHGTDCGIYAVGTAPNWRRRGLASAMMRSVLGDAYRRGARTATLQSTPMGEPLYASLGFDPVGRYQEWVPA
jgi:GNAT superfamily N-acetyltransferase